MQVTKVKKFKLKRQWPWQKKCHRFLQDKIQELHEFILKEAVRNGASWIIMSPDLVAMLSTLPTTFLRPVKDTLGEYTMEPTGARVTTDIFAGGNGHEMYAILRPCGTDRMIILNCGKEEDIIGHDIGNVWESNDGCQS